MSNISYKSSSNVSFIVQNNSKKKIRIFNYPLWPGQSRDLLKIPNISEADIRASLLKGQLQFMISAGQITVIQSDVDLIQFNTSQQTFLQNAGVSSSTTDVIAETATATTTAISSALGTTRTFLSPLDPSISSSLLAWYDPRSVIQSGGLISQHNDLSSNANHATATSGARAKTATLNGTPAFQTTNDGTNAVATLTNEITTVQCILMVYQRVGPGVTLSSILGSNATFLDFAGSSTAPIMFAGASVNTNIKSLNSAIRINGQWSGPIRTDSDAYRPITKPSVPTLLTFIFAGPVRFNNLGMDRVAARVDNAIKGHIVILSSIPSAANIIALENQLMLWSGFQL